MRRHTTVRSNPLQRVSNRLKPVTTNGMTILEVLFAIMITTIGILGAIAVFPVANEMARKGRRNDEILVCANTAVHRFDAQYMRRPDRWVRYVYNTNSNSYVPTTSGAIAGESYCIDPRFYAQNSNPVAQANVFPAFPQQNMPVAYNFPPNVGPPRMTRLTVTSGAPFGAPMGRFQADYVFSFEDQLAYERPGVQKGALARNDNASPAFQLYTPIKINNGAQTLPGKREDDGKLSWMVTLVPKIDQYSGTFDDQYVLSTVIFYGRSSSLTYNPGGLLNEWSAVILGQSLLNNAVSDFHSSGYGGGEVTITADTADKLKMRVGDWIMLAGYIRGPLDGLSKAMPTPYTVRKTFKWYRITEADEDPYTTLVGGVTYYQRGITLVGPDWNLVDVCPVGIDPDSGYVDSYPDNNGSVDDVEVFIVPNVVAVFDRTVRLEGDGTGY